MKQPDRWREISAEKRKLLLSLIPNHWRLPHPLPSIAELPDVTNGTIQKYLSPREIEITETEVTQLIQRTTTGQWRAREVVEAFCHRAALAHQMINCLHEIFFEAALEEADRLDAFFETHGKPMGPLHGLPMSLKDSIHVRGVDASMGFVGWLDTFEGTQKTEKEASHESEIVLMLRELGAVPFVKTSVPIASFSGETFNQIIGHTPNPRNRNLAVGGSSGGEGGLLALKGSPIGLGTDVGGSIRVPAGWNGCYGLRPSTGRLPYQGIASILSGQIAIPFVVGPLCPSIEGIEILIRNLLSLKPWTRDPLVHEIPWRNDVFEQTLTNARTKKRQLAFGILRSDKIVNPQPPVNRAIEMVVKAIKSLGHSTIDWNPPSHSDAIRLWANIYLADGGKEFHDALALSGEPSYRTDLDHGPSQSEVPSTMFGLKPREATDAIRIMETQRAINDYRKSYLDYWNSSKDMTTTGAPVDALIMPLSPFPPPPKGKVRYFGYTTVLNVLDLTVCTIPVTTVDRNLDRYASSREEYEALNGVDRLVRDDYDVELSHGAPVAVQLVGRRLQEESVLALANVLSKELQRQEVSQGHLGVLL